MKQASQETLRHSTAHVLAAAVKNLFPGTKLGIGPVIENGFYYDFDLKNPLSSDEFPKIEAEMRRLVKEAIPFERLEKSVDEALDLTKKIDEPLKHELVEELKKQGEKTVSFYQTGEFVDLCRGPHVGSTAELGVFKLLSLAAAYWKSDEKNQSLTRVYGTAWESEKELTDYLEALEKAKENDHRKIGKELGLFVFSDLVGQGLPILTPKGASIRRTLERFIQDEEISRGYQHVLTPPLAKVDLYRTSGHYPYYKDTMYPSMKVDNDELILRPMTCPHHFMLYKASPHSYRELPIRYAELASQFRYEKSGELSGLMRVRMFTLSDAHIFVTKDQVENELKNVLDLIDSVNQALGLQKDRDYRFRLSLGDRNDDKKYYKDDKAWEEAEGILRKVLTETNAPFFEAVNEAAFYGPKIDVQMRNVAGKEETAYTVQYDFVQPKRFELSYIDESGKEAQPIVIHRSSIGAFERIMAFLIEHYGGKLPFWISPVQFEIIPIADRHLEYAKQVEKSFIEAGYRTEINAKSEPMGAKVRAAQLQKIPFMLIVGDKEQAQKKVALRNLDGEDVGTKTIEQILNQARQLLPRNTNATG